MRCFLSVSNLVSGSIQAQLLGRARFSRRPEGHFANWGRQRPSKISYLGSDKGTVVSRGSKKQAAVPSPVSGKLIHHAFRLEPTAIKRLDQFSDRGVPLATG